jgi:hypothetical protein
MAVKGLMRKRLKGFPLLGECVDACIEAKRFLEVKNPELKSREQREAEEKDRAGYYFSIAEELIRTQPMAKQAAREGWILALYWFLVKNGRLPDYQDGKRVDQGEIRKLREDTRDHAESVYPQIMRGVTGHPAHVPSLQGLANAMEARRELLRRWALGEGA